MKSNLISFAIDFTSFLLQKIKIKEEISNVILFGSAAREEADASSDVDIFVDVSKESIKTESEIKKRLDEFVASSKYKNYWKLIGVENNIKLIVGKLERWKELRPAVIANGIILYGKFKPEIKEGKHKTFFIWENIKPNSKRVSLNKQLFGHKQMGKFYQGLLQKRDGERLGKGCIIVPLEHSVVFHKLFKKYKVIVRIKKVLEYI
jgi:predicted nucleotidyltransferase